MSQHPTDFAGLPAAPPLEEPDTEWHRLNPRVMIADPLNEIASVFGVLVLILVVRGRFELELWETAIALGISGVLVGYAMVRWLTTRYRVTAKHVELHSGWLVKKHRQVARDRLRTVDLTASVPHRLVGLAVVRLGTGRQDAGTEDELTLNAITKAQAENLRLTLLRREVSPQPAETPEAPSQKDSPGTLLSKMDPKWLRFAPLTLFGVVAVGTLLGGAAAIARQIKVDLFHIGPVQAVVDWFTTMPLLTTIPVIVAGGLVISTIAGVAVYVILYWNYELNREEHGSLLVRYGLLEVRSVSIEQKRMRGAKVEEPLLLRTGKGAKCSAVATGLGTGAGSGMLLPQAPRAEAHRVAAEALQLTESPTTAALTRHPRAALLRRLFRATVPLVALAAVLGGLRIYLSFPDWPWIVALCLLPFSLLLGIDRYRNLGHAHSQDHLVSRSGSLIRQTVALHRHGIIGWKITRSIFQRRVGLVTLHATTGASTGRAETETGAYSVEDIGEADALRLAETALPGLLTPFLERVPPLNADGKG
ncbi:PH domain-containing protein [Allokutzneria sp. A3M-2-11 16]|uniref:PH domain-containing protein n=1 Tax=Allokutzneria sp. A3M-2-11 16 TaxID=2962043 RepID=UPI0020B7C8F4|nr:PH domain-containing protein [Allokutzneria sp. A3M-2-11 16]MCP3800805.1 PH domain-containing protein [Allokutzneria sp. A3M-2-11 16]